MTGKGARRKGHNFEREIANTLKPIFEKARRGFQAREGTEFCDVEGTPYWIECKRCKRVSVRAAYDQAVRDSDGREPVVISKEDRGMPLVTMHLETFLELLSEKKPR